MSARDIMPFTYGGGNTGVVAYPMNVSATFSEGEPVASEAAGTIIEASTDPDPTADPPTVIGIAGVSALRAAQTQGIGNVAPFAANFLCPVYVFEGPNEFITRNLFDGSDTLIAPAVSNISDRGALRLTATGVWGLDINAAAANEDFIITRVLNTQKDDLSRNSGTGATGVFVVFRRTEE